MGGEDDFAVVEEVLGLAAERGIPAAAMAPAAREPVDQDPARGDRDDARTRAGDNDCDGVASARDCDDRDADNNRLNTNDLDCDGVPSAVDCDDTDASLTTTNAGDKDCDGRGTATDCDDTDPTVQDCPVCDDGDNDGHGGRSDGVDACLDLSLIHISEPTRPY